MSDAVKYATRDELFSRPTTRRYKDVEVEGMTFRLRSLTAGESNPWAVKSSTPKGMVTAGARLIALCVVDESGNRVFGDTDVAKLLDMDSGFVAALAKECQEHCGLVVEGELEGIEKN